MYRNQYNSSILYVSKLPALLYGLAPLFFKTTANKVHDYNNSLHYVEWCRKSIQA